MNAKESACPYNSTMYLTLQHVDVRYAGQPKSAVQGVSLKLEAGQIGVLIGPSGCGKTSLLRAIAGLRERLALEIRGILKAAKATALFVTHDQMEAFAIGDVIGVIQEGRLAQWDDAYHLYHRPASRFVAEFIGHGVFIPGHRKVVGARVEVATVLGLLTDELDASQVGGLDDRACDVLLRADDIVHDDEAQVKAEIIRKAFRGSEFLYTLRLQSGDIVLAHVPSHHDHKLGEWIGIRAEVDHVVTFD